MLATKRTSRANCSFQISAAVITVTHSQASDVLVGTQKHEDLWVWAWVTVVDTMPCFRDSKKKKDIDLSTLSRHSEPFGASWPSSDLQAAAVTQACSGGHAAAQEWKHRCFSVQTGRERGGAEAEGGWLARPRSFVCSPVYTIGQISAACKPTNVFQSKDLRLEETNNCCVGRRCCCCCAAAS